MKTTIATKQHSFLLHPFHSEKLWQDTMESVELTKTHEYQYELINNGKQISFTTPININERTQFIVAN